MCCVVGAKYQSMTIRGDDSSITRLDDVSVTRCDGMRTSYDYLKVTMDN